MKRDGDRTPRTERRAKIAARTSGKPRDKVHAKPRVGARPGAPTRDAKGGPSRPANRGPARPGQHAPTREGRDGRDGRDKAYGQSRAGMYAASNERKGPKQPKHEVLPPITRQVTFPQPSPARVGEWLLTTRPESELDLLEELTMTPFDEKSPLPRLAGPSLVAVPSLPKHNRPELAFARQGFLVGAIVPLDDRDVAPRLARALQGGLMHAQARAARELGPQPFAIDIWVPDHDKTNPQSAAAELLLTQVVSAFAAIDPGWARHRTTDARASWTDNGLYAQICVSEGHAYIGVMPAREAPSLAPGGRLRIHLPKHAPSRAAAKLLEAFAWLDRAPEPGEMCADLGAAPGGWSWVLLERRAKVLAIDPGRLDPIVAKRHGLTHLRADAFSYEPEGYVDWLVADMAWRPLEAAALYGKWARKGWARMLIANIKLPMKKKAEYLIRVRDILTKSGWGSLRVRQLYHDREEVTVGAVRSTTR